MADTTIGGLSQGIPDKGSAIIPFSDGSNTYRTAPSGIVAASPGSLLQVVTVTDNTSRVTSLTIPADNSIPQITEGDLFLSLSITPKSNDSKLLFLFEAYFQEASNTGDHAAFPLFRNLESNAIHVWHGELTSNILQNMNSFSGHLLLQNNTTNTTLYTVRWGNNNGSLRTLGNTLYYPAGLYGGLVSNKLTVQEIAG